MKHAIFSYNEEDLRPYFALDDVLDGLFLLLRRLFDIEVTQFHFPEGTQWDPLVRFYEFKKDGDTRAFCFIDPIARSGEKRGGAWMDEVSACNCINAFRFVAEINLLPIGYLWLT